MRHNIMASTLLLHGRDFELSIRNGKCSLHLLNRFVGNVEAKRFLGLGEVEPECTPSAEAVARAEDVLHLPRTVP